MSHLVPHLRHLYQTISARSKFLGSLDTSQKSVRRFCIIIVLLIGLFFRFANLDRKAYWRDEVDTSLRISGYTWTEVVQQVYDGRLLTPEDLQTYQHPNPEKGLVDTLNSVAAEAFPHSPLYFILARFWAQTFGNSVAVMRGLSALISLFTFPCLYWLCLELFESPLVGWVAIALTSVSLFHVMYAQEARPYGLWIVTILLSSAALLRAMRCKTKLSWAVYAATLALGFYTFLLAGLVAVGHGIYVAATERVRLSSKILRDYLIASLAGFLAFTPWLFVLANHINTSAKSVLNDQVPLPYLVQGWLINLSYTFLSVRFSSIWVILILIGYAICFIFHKTSPRVWLFVLILIGVTPIALIVPDLIMGGKRSAIGRYLIPCYLGIQLAVAYLLTTQMFAGSVNIWRRKSWQLVAIALISVGIWSCIRFSQTENGWNKGDFQNIPIARIINQSDAPLVISDARFSETPTYIRLGSHYINFKSLVSFQSLIYNLAPNVGIQLVVEPNVPEIPETFSEVFLFNPSTALQDGIKKKYGYQEERLFTKAGISLWKLTKH